MTVILLLSGCGGPAYEYDSVVTGTVTIDGELANSGTVTFHPVKDGIPAIGRIHSDGSYSLRTGQGNLREVDGGTVIPGQYLVTVSVTGPPAEGAVVAEGGPPISGPSLIARRYARKETTDLQFDVKPGPQVIVLNLDRAEPQEPPSEASEDSADTTPEADGDPPIAAPAETVEKGGAGTSKDGAADHAATPTDSAE